MRPDIWWATTALPSSAGSTSGIWLFAVPNVKGIEAPFIDCTHDLRDINVVLKFNRELETLNQ
jgi:hypothetical protein